MLPKMIRDEVYDRLSTQTMRFVDVAPRRRASGLVARIYQMISEDFFINGSITCHSQVPALMAGMWMGGRETMLVDDHLDHTTKLAMSATLSQLNDCPYCADMLVGLVHGGGKHQAASNIFANREERIEDGQLKARLLWVKRIAEGKTQDLPPVPFAPEELPEAIGNLHSIGYINRVSHVIMDGSPVVAPFGLQRVKDWALRLFGFDLKVTTERQIEPGRALDLLPPAPLPERLAWAAPNPRIADAMARWAAAVEAETPRVASPEVRDLVERNLRAWNGEVMPLSRSWVERETQGLTGRELAVARLALVTAKAPWQFDPSLAEAVLGKERDQKRLIRTLAWAAFAATTRIAQLATDAAECARTTTVGGRSNKATAASVA